MLLSDISSEEVARLAAEFESYDLERILAWCWERFGERAAIGTSFQGAGLVTLHVARTHGFNFPVFTIDTDLLFPETLELKAKLERKYDFEIESLHPEQTLEEQAREMGEELWKTKPDVCCMLRKVVPLQNKLTELDVWITGVRRQQSDTRKQTKILELYKFDVLRDRHILKLNPMALWTRERVQAFLKEHEIPTNPLLLKGYRSIGCMPCTRPVTEGENERAGRWTGFDKAECGIHTFLGSNI
ncbi:MAG: phosphoadenylyl-sulfate reductase [Chthoniobacterales bacterium]